MNARKKMTAAALGLAMLAATSAQAKPIAYARGTAVMAEHGAGTMDELQVFYAPRYWWSAGAGWVHYEAEDGSYAHRVSYLRANLLAKRWNLPGAQANVFVWGGLGTARGSDFSGGTTAWNAGAQFDFETRRLYASLRSDLQESDHFSHRIDTAQLGFAPYEHDYDTLATWLLLQARRYSGDLQAGTETALLLRLFKNGIWLEAGATRDGRPQAMLMLNF